MQILPKNLIGKVIEDAYFVTDIRPPKYGSWLNFEKIEKLRIVFTDHSSIDLSINGSYDTIGSMNDDSLDLKIYP